MRGYEGATIRGSAERAGIDPRWDLLFGSKDELARPPSSTCASLGQRVMVATPLKPSLRIQCTILPCWRSRKQ